MSEHVHFFTAHGAPCGATSGARWSVVVESVTCAPCADALRAQELEALERRFRAPRVIARLRARARA